MIKFILFPVALSCIVLSGCGNESDGGRSFGRGEPYLYVDQKDSKLLASLKSFKSSRRDGPTIKLMGMIHVGEPDFYQQVQKQIDQADVVIYEGIGASPNGDDYAIKARLIPACISLFSAIKYGNLAANLGLVEQSLEYPSYKSVWADFSLEQHLDAIIQTPFGLAKQTTMPNGLFDSKCYQILWLAQENCKSKSHPMCQVDFLGDSNKVARHLSSKLSSIHSRKDLVFMQPDDWELVPGLSKVVIEQRNDIVLKKLAEQLNLSSSATILVVYGAAHMPDIEARMMYQHGFVPDREYRLTVFGY